MKTKFRLLLGLLILSSLILVACDRRQTNSEALAPTGLFEKHEIGSTPLTEVTLTSGIIDGSFFHFSGTVESTTYVKFSWQTKPGDYIITTIPQTKLKTTLITSGPTQIQFELYDDFMNSRTPYVSETGDFPTGGPYPVQALNDQNNILNYRLYAAHVFITAENLKNEPLLPGGGQK